MIANLHNGCLQRHAWNFAVKLCSYQGNIREQSGNIIFRICWDSDIADDVMTYKCTLHDYSVLQRIQYASMDFPGIVRFRTITMKKGKPL